ncbi:MAG TPA: M15 family metallopeptidase [Bdellovibrionales bacterium]|nr:M15 family metallopeptidase [Bdellovibrionales bacterium]
MTKQILTTLLTSLVLFQAHAQSGPTRCQIGSGQVAIPRGNQSGYDLMTPVSKRSGEMLAETYSPTSLSEVPLEYISPEIRAKAQSTNATIAEKMRSDALRSLEILLDESRRAGIQLFVHSGFRDYSTQCKVFNFKLMQEREQHRGIHEGDAIVSVNKRSAFPGQSEHQLGAVVDLVTNIPGMGYKLEPQMDQTPAYRWLQQNAHNYGYVLSYPKGTVNVTDPHPQTGYIYEPWHWRYIGEREAQNYKRCRERMSMVLQDFLRVMKQNPNFYCR